MDFSTLAQSLNDPIFLIAQGVGVIALITELISYQLKSKRQILIFLIISTLVYAVHYFMLGAWSGSITVLIMFLILLCVVIKDKHNARWMGAMYFFIIINLAVGGYTLINGGQWFDFLPALINVFTVVVLWKVKDAQKLRYLSIAMYTAWGVYNVFIFSFPSVIADLASITSIIIGAVRYGHQAPSTRRIHHIKRAIAHNKHKSIKSTRRKSSRKK